MQVIVDSLLVNYQRKGKGKKILLLHGWADSLNGMSGLFSNLSKNFDVVAVDLPGFGASQTPEGTWGLEDFASFLSKLVEKLEVDNLYAVIGHSNGGAIAIKSLAENDLNAEKLVLLSSSGIRGDQKGKLTALKFATKTAKLISTTLPASTKKKLRGRLYSTIGSDLLAANNMTETFKKIVKQDVRSDASKLNIPTLIIYGEEDDQTPVAYGELYHQLIDGSTFEVVGNAGHFILRDKPETVVKLIRDFL